MKLTRQWLQCFPVWASRFRGHGSLTPKLCLQHCCPPQSRGHLLNSLLGYFLLWGTVKERAAGIWDFPKLWVKAFAAWSPFFFSTTDFLTHESHNWDRGSSNSREGWKNIQKHILCCLRITCPSIVVSAPPHTTVYPTHRLLSICKSVILLTNFWMPHLGKKYWT